MTPFHNFVAGETYTVTISPAEIPDQDMKQSLYSSSISFAQDGIRLMDNQFLTIVEYGKYIEYHLLKQQGHLNSTSNRM